jgi:predicted RND superfamily exporter protein
LAALIARTPTKVLLICLMFTACAGYLGRDVRTDSALLEMYHEGHPTWEAVQLAEEEAGGVIPLFLHLSGEEGQMLEPDVLARVARLEEEVKAQAMVGWTVSAAGWLAHFHSLLTGEDGLPPSREAAAQELLLAEMSGDLPLDTVLSDDRARTRILVVAKDMGGRETLKVKHHIERFAADLFADTGIEVDVTGDGMLAAHSVDALIKDLLASLGLVLVVIVVTMFALLRDVRQTLIATVPNLVPLVFILGTLGLMGVDLQTSNIVSFTVAVGLAVDDTIHFIVRYREEHRKCPDITTAVHNTFHGAGPPIVLTSILLVLGFGVLAFSSLTSTYFFGILACVTMVAALLGDLFLLPAMLHLFDKRRTG